MFSLPGAIYHYKMVYSNIINKIKPSVFYDGLENCSWNGGRSNVENLKWDENIIEKYYQYGHKIALTFSNRNIDLDDKTGNYLLELLNKNNNYVIYSNSELGKLIRKKYKNIQLVYSITQTLEQYDKKWYEDKLSVSDYVVPRVSYIEKISHDFTDLDRFIVMVNHSCPSDCPYWKNHYDSIDSDNKKSVYNSYDNKMIECWIKKDLPDKIHTVMNIESNVQKYMNLGFTHFKMAGREFSSEQLIHDINSIKKYLWKC